MISLYASGSPRAMGDEAQSKRGAKKVHGVDASAVATGECKEHGMCAVGSNVAPFMASELLVGDPVTKEDHTART